MNLLDIALIAIVLFSIGAGVWKGLVREILNIVGVLAAILLSLMLASSFAPHMGSILPYDTSGYAESLIVIFVVTLIAATVIGHLLTKVIEAVKLGGMNRALGGVFGLVRGLLIGLFLVLGLALFLPDLRCWPSRSSPRFLGVGARAGLFCRSGGGNTAAAAGCAPRPGQSAPPSESV
jgi:membrane protein required for colicin V production